MCSVYSRAKFSDVFVFCVMVPDKELDQVWHDTN